MRDNAQTDKAYFQAIRLGQIAGMSLLIAGIIVTILGLTGAVELKLALGPIDGWLKNASPGLILAMFGIALLVFYKPKKRYSKRETLEVSDEVAQRDELLLVIQTLLASEDKIDKLRAVSGEPQRTSGEVNANIVAALKHYMEVRHLYNLTNKTTWKALREEMSELEVRLPQLDAREIERLLRETNAMEEPPDDET